MVFTYPVALDWTYPGLSGKIRPSGNGILHLPDNLMCGADAEPIGNRQQIRLRNAGKFTVHRHEMLPGPLAGWIEGVRYIICRCQFPLPTFPQHEGYILGVVVAVYRNNIENNAPECFFECSIIKAQTDNGLQKLAVIVGRLLFVVQMRHGAE